MCGLEVAIVKGEDEVTGDTIKSGIELVIH